MTSRSPLDRRHFIQTAGSALLTMPLAQMGFSGSLMAADAAKSPAAGAAPGLEPLNRFPRMLQEHLVDQLHEQEAKNAAVRASLKTKADAEAHVRSIRERIQKCFGPWPEKTPLNARVMNTVERDTYKIENVIFESRPGFFVTANLYVPKGRKGKMPGVVGSCGHSTNGKAAEAYQSFAQGLARMGYVVLIFDPIGQGERSQYAPVPKGKGLAARYGIGVGEHIQAGNQQVLVGESLPAWRAWDGIRALDYLLSREEVDPKHVGITGNSGGGTMTTWLCGVDQRWSMAAPACFVTTFRRNAENELPADTEQCPFGVIAQGLDHADFLAALAPKPVVIVAQEKDFFDVRGSEEAFARLKHLYTLLGAPENIKLHIGGDYHGYAKENREAMYQWFNKATGISKETAEPALTIEEDKTLYCTPTGQVRDLQSRTVFSFTSEKAQSLKKSRAKLEAQALKKAITEVLHIPVKLPESAPDYRVLRGSGSRKYPAKTHALYAVETEPGIHAIVTLLSEKPIISRPHADGKKAVLYVSHRSADAELRDEPLVTELLKNNADSTLYACDVRGIGDSQPDTCGADQFLKPYGSHYFYAAHGIMLDEPLLGRRVFDVMRVVQWLASIGHTEVHLAGNGWGALPVTFAALLHGSVSKVTLKHALNSFTEVAGTEDYNWPYAALPPRVLLHFDLPQCYAALQSKGLTTVEPWSATQGMD
jgi:cephalosporin-C deacetylase-like acetyl esterase